MKKLLSILLALSMILGGAVSMAEKEYEDTRSMLEKKLGKVEKIN